jgi:hypothetical protein
MKQEFFYNLCIRTLMATRSGTVFQPACTCKCKNMAVKVTFLATTTDTSVTCVSCKEKPCY